MCLASYRQPLRIVVAVPVASPETCEPFRIEVEEVICVITPEPFVGVGAWYSDFRKRAMRRYESCWNEPRGIRTVIFLRL